MQRIRYFGPNANEINATVTIRINQNFLLTRKSFFQVLFYRYSLKW